MMKQKPDATKAKETILINATMLFAKKGFDGTTIRDIATNSKVAVSAVPFYYESKEKLYETVIKRAANIIESHYSQLIDEINDVRLNQLFTKDIAWNYIVELVSLHVEWCFSRENLFEKLLVSKENQITTKAYPFLKNAITNYVLRPMSELMIEYTSAPNREWAETYAFQVMGSFLSFYNEAQLLLALSNCDIDDLATSNRLKRRAKSDFLLSIKAVLDYYSTNNDV